MGKAGYIPAGLAMLLLAGSAVAGTPELPVAQIIPAQDSFGPATLIDHYRWMEQSPNPDLDAYLRQYGSATSTILGRLPERAKIAADITALRNAATKIEQIVPDGDTIFYLKRGPEDDVARLIERGLSGGPEHVLVDPEALPDAPPHARITGIAPSPDGNYVAYVLQPGGPETGVVRVYDLLHKTSLSEHLPNAGFANISWQADSKGFFYAAFPGGAANAAPNQRYAHMKVFLHHLGAEAATDLPVLNTDHLPFTFHGAPFIFPRIVVPFGADDAIAVISDGVSPEIAVYTVPASELAMQPAPWRPVAEQGMGVTQIAVSATIAFMLSNKDAPGGRVLMEDLSDPDPANARTVLPAGNGVITGIAAAVDALFISRREGAASHLLRLDYRDSTPQEVNLPFTGNIAPPLGEPGALVAEPRVRGALFGVENWIHPTIWMRYDSSIHRAVDLELLPPYPRDLSAYTTIETTAPGRDGTAIPLSIILRRDTKPDHARPTLIEAYGAFGYSYYPRFLSNLLPFADRGGVIAIAHIRGGGELGENWHQAGRMGNHANTVNDLLACADALIKLGYTSPEHLGLRGTGAGVVAAGDAIAKSPNLFRAAILRGGLPNLMRAGNVVDADLNTAEFGSPRNPAQLPALLAMDPYQNIRDGAAYPAVLLTATLDDPRTPAWQQAKMAARLQASSTSGNPILLAVNPSRVQTPQAMADSEAAELSFLLWQLNGGGALPEAAPAVAPVVKRKHH